VFSGLSLYLFSLTACCRYAGCFYLCHLQVSIFYHLARSVDCVRLPLPSTLPLYDTFIPCCNIHLPAYVTRTGLRRGTRPARPHSLLSSDASIRRERVRNLPGARCAWTRHLFTVGDMRFARAPPPQPAFGLPAPLYLCVLCHTRPIPTRHFYSFALLPPLHPMPTHHYLTSTCHSLAYLPHYLLFIVPYLPLPLCALCHLLSTFLHTFILLITSPLLYHSLA